MTKKNSQEGQKKESKFEKVFPFLIPIWIVFNPITIIIVLLIIALCIGVYETTNNRILTGKIKEQLLPLCLGDYYVLSDYSFINLSYDNIIRDQKIASCNIDYTFIEYIAYTKSYHYVLLKQRPNYFSFTNYLCRFTHDLANCECLLSFKTSTSPLIISGYNSIIYYETSDNEWSSNVYYFSIDLEALEEPTLISESEGQKLFGKGDYYRNSLGVFSGDCIRQNDKCSYTIENMLFEFDEQKIDRDIRSLINEFGFKPKQFLSFETGATSILYYTHGGATDNDDCLLITYDRFTQEVSNYQLFQPVNSRHVYLYPKLDDYFNF